VVLHRRHQVLDEVKLSRQSVLLLPNRAPAHER
jgi:hypothetical protein